MDSAFLLPLGILVGLVTLAVGAALSLHAGVPRTPFLPSERERAELDAARRFCLGPCRSQDGTCPLDKTALGQRSCPLWRSLEQRLGVQVAWGAIA